MAKTKDMTSGLGAHSVIEAVGTQESFMQAVHIRRPGAHMGFVGVNSEVQIPGIEMFFAEIQILGGPAPERRFLSELIDLIWNRRINPGMVFRSDSVSESSCRGLSW